jgi:hypothetical protein
MRRNFDILEIDLEDFMVWYSLSYGGAVLGDELIVPSSYWKSTVGTKSGSGEAETIVKLDDTPLSLALYPQFQLRKKCAGQWDFERWIFDLMSLADGVRRQLYVGQSDDTLIVDYGYCKLLSVKRPKHTGPYTARWSDQVVVTFQADTEPIFF